MATQSKKAIPRSHKRLNGVVKCVGEGFVLFSVILLRTHTNSHTSMLLEYIYLLIYSFSVVFYLKNVVVCNKHRHCAAIFPWLRLRRSKKTQRAQYMDHSTKNWLLSPHSVAGGQTRVFQAGRHQHGGLGDRGSTRVPKPLKRSRLC